MLTERQFIKRLHETGHFWNPEFPNALNVGLADLPLVVLSDRVAKEAVASWQISDQNFRTLAGLVHGRDINPDGDWGPVTDFMLNVKRCAMPDFPPPSDAQFAYDDPYLQGAVESMQRFNMAGATGTGSFPVPGCDPLRKNRQTEHSIVLNINIANAPASVVSAYDEIVLYCRKLAAEKGLAARYVKNGPKAQTHYQEFAFLAGSTIGINYFPEPGTCNQIVTGRIDSGYTAKPIVCAGLWSHEAKGHGTGLNHTRGGIMNPSILDLDPLTWIGDPSEAIYNRYFGGAAIPLDDTEPIPVRTFPEFTGPIFAEPFAGGIAIRGEPILKLLAAQTIGDYQYIIVPDSGRYKLVPRPVV